MIDQSMRTDAERAHIKERNAWVNLVLGVDVEALTAQAAAALLPMADCVARLKAVREDAALFGQDDAIRQPLFEAAAALKTGNRGVLAMIEALEQQMASAASARRAGEATAMTEQLKTASGMGRAAFARLRLRLDNARSQFAGAIENLKASCFAVLETEDFLEDPRSMLPETQSAIAALGGRIPAIGTLADTLDDSIDRMIQAVDPAERVRDVATALAAIATYRDAIDAEPLLREMEHTEAGDFAIHSSITAVLDELATALRG